MSAKLISFDNQQRQWEGIESEILEKNLPLRSKYKATDTLNEYEKTGKANVMASWQQTKIGGAAFVNSTGGGIAHNRNIPIANPTYATATNTRKWTSAEGIKNLRIFATSGTDEAISANEGFIAVINAPNDATAAAWLADDGAESQDVLYEGGSLFETLLISRTAPILRIDVKPLNNVLRLVIGATP